jgi:(heptosyl)LPS beta-1,4-glucosyltransferase
MPLPFSAIILTLNEEKNILRCLNSLSFVDEVLVIDSGSTDHTQSLALTFPHTRVITTPWQGYRETKQVGIQNARNDWIFWIDADEVATPELIQELHQIFASSSFLKSLGGLSCPRKTFVLNQWVRHSGWYPSRTIRIFHKSLSSSQRSFASLFLHKS